MIAWLMIQAHDPLAVVEPLQGHPLQQARRTNQTSEGPSTAPPASACNRLAAIAVANRGTRGPKAAHTTRAMQL